MPKLRQWPAPARAPDRPRTLPPMLPCLALSAPPPPPVPTPLDLARRVGRPAARAAPSPPPAAALPALPALPLHRRFPPVIPGPSRTDVDRPAPRPPPARRARAPPPGTAHP